MTQFECKIIAWFFLAVIGTVILYIGFQILAAW